jgi:UDP-N-acetylmuramoylalanine--D-glutamate ligase
LSHELAGRHVLVVGAGVAGAAMSRALVEGGAVVRVSERRPEDELASGPELRELGVDLRAGGHDETHLADVASVFVSPGIPQDVPLLRDARDARLEVWGEMELGAWLCEAPIVAVTGTNGKTTTTGMIASCLRAGGVDAVACGNIGYPFPTAATAGHDALVVECSSFQLQMQESLHPRVSVLLNLAPDHLDWHGSYEAYVAAKARIYARQGESDTHVGTRDDPEAAAVSAVAPCVVRWTTGGVPSPGEVGLVKGRVVEAHVAGEVDLGPVDVSRGGFGADAVAAAAAALAFGIEAGAISDGLAAYEPAPHRGELVAVVDGVAFYDNSKATNLHAALTAIDGVDDAILIAGGDAKGADLSGLASRAGRLRGVVAIGDAAPGIVEIFDERVPVRSASSIERAVNEAHAMADGVGSVLLAPACASWDQFSGYEERGDRFAAAARAIEGAGADG